MHSKSIILLFIFASFAGNASISPDPFVSSLDSKNAIILPKQDNTIHLMNSMARLKNEGVLQFASPINVSYTPENSGVWESSLSGKLIWRLMLKSEGSHSINVGFNTYQLPSGAKLLLYDDKKKMVRVFDETDNEEHGQLWTPIIYGDMVVIELQIQSNQIDKYKLELTKVNHDFIGFGKSVSGSCNLDVICGEFDGFPQVEEYRDVISGVGAFHINGIQVCSGSLVNNVRNDKTPYFLTADHCGINAGNDASVVVYWNFESNYCRPPNSPESGAPGNGTLDQFNSGSIFRSSDGRSDFCLIELDDPLKEEHELFLSGWSAEPQFPASAVCIHHPGVEEKRISFEEDPTQADSDANYIEIADWDIGTTEGGSSGSPLFNPDRKIIGQLYGGLAACGNDLYDTYGRFSSSWDFGSTNNSLKPWLDPDNTGILEMDGLNTNFTLNFANEEVKLCTMESSDTLVIAFTVSETFDDFVNVQVNDLPGPLQVISLSENIIPGGEGELVITNISSLLAGDYIVKLLSTDGLNVAENDFNIYVSNDTPPGNVLVAPEDGANLDAITALLSWEAIPGIDFYQIDISKDASFSEIEFSANVTDNEYATEDLEASEEYFWRVRTTNHCGQNEWSEIFSFVSSNVYCLVIESEDTPITISTNGEPTVRSNVFCDYPILLLDISIPNIDISHTWISDIDMNIRNPENAIVTDLIDRPCADESNLYMGFDDAGIAGNLPCPPVDGQRYQPIDALRDLQGINAQGQWILEVNDNVNQDGGQLKSWSAELCFSELLEAAIVPTQTQFEACLGNPANVSFYYDLKGGDPEGIVITDLIGNEVPYSLGSVELVDKGSIEIILQVEDYSLGTYELFVESDSGMTGNFLINIVEGPEVSLSYIYDEGILADLSTVEWQGQHADVFLIEIATNASFTDIIWTKEVAGDVQETDGPDLADGSYYIRILAIAKCGELLSESYNFMIDESVNVQESKDNQLNVYPIPASESLNIGGISGENVEINIYSISGLKLLEHKVSIDQVFSLDVTSLHTGIYFIEVFSQQKRSVAKIVIQK